MTVIQRNNVSVVGNNQGPPMMFAHGFGCDQNMWRYVTPVFEDDYEVVLFDHVGSGKSDLDAYDYDKYSSLEGYASDILEIIEELSLTDVVFVGHSVASMMGVLAANKKPDLFRSLVLVGPSPRYINDSGYAGGFAEDEIDDLLVSLESNYLGWSKQMAPAIMGNPERPELGEELTNSFCATDPDIAAHFASVTFKSDNRADLAFVTVPTLVLQCSDDVIAPDEVGDFVATEIPNSRFVKMAATGHCPNLSAPQETIEAIKNFL